MSSSSVFHLVFSEWKRRTKVKHLAWVMVAAVLAAAALANWKGADAGGGGPRSRNNSPAFSEGKNEERTPSRSRGRDSGGDSPPPPPANRTSPGRVLVFHRVPKTGSEMMQEMGKALARLKGFRAFVDPWPPVYFPTEEQSEAFAENFKKEVLEEVEGEGGKDGVYYRHMPHFPWTAHGLPRPSLVGMVRHPVDRVVSWFQYIRWHDRPGERCS